MKIDKKLNLVVPVESDEGNAYFHSTPIQRETFQRYHFVMCAAFTRLLNAGMELTGAKVAAMTLEEVAKEMGKWDGAIGVEKGLMNEIERLTNVVALSDEGWGPMPVSDAIKRDLIDEDDWWEAKQRIVFFTLVCAMTRMAVRDDLLGIMNDSWQTQTTSSSCTEFIDSLPMLSEIEASAGKVKQSQDIT